MKLLLTQHAPTEVVPLSHECKSQPYSGMGSGSQHLPELSHFMVEGTCLNVGCAAFALDMLPCVVKSSSSDEEHSLSIFFFFLEWGHTK